MSRCLVSLKLNKRKKNQWICVNWPIWSCNFAILLTRSWMKPRLTPGSQNEILNYWPLIGRQWDQFTVNCHFFRVKSSIVSVIILCLPDSVSFETWDTNLFEAFFAYWVSTSVIKLSFINHIEMFLVRYTNGNFGNRELNQKQPWQVLWLQKPFSVQCRALRIAYFNIYKIGNSQCTAL